MHETLLKDAGEVGVLLDRKQIRLFLHYLRELKEWNQKINLTSLDDDESIIKNHFIDSLSIIPHLPRATTFLDLGSGAGFPGVPVKIALPNLQVTLLEVTRKKVNFLRHLIRILNLSQIGIIEGRADVSADHGHPPFDIVASRGLASLKRFILLGAPLVKKGGYLVAMKGAKAADELLESDETLRRLSLALYHKQEVKIPGLKKQRSLILLQKS